MKMLYSKVLATKETAIASFQEDYIGYSTSDSSYN